MMDAYHARLAGAPCLLAARSYFNSLMRQDASGSP
jgi:hypothetical protein